MLQEYLNPPSLAAVIHVRQWKYTACTEKTGATVYRHGKSFTRLTLQNFPNMKYGKFQWDNVQCKFIVLLVTWANSSYNSKNYCLALHLLQLTFVGQLGAAETSSCENPSYAKTEAFFQKVFLSKSQPEGLCNVWVPNHEDFLNLWLNHPSQTGTQIDFVCMIERGWLASGGYLLEHPLW